jgi:putative FmdB family regulatory protein
MPIYAYQCQACQHSLEALQKLSDAPLSICPACGADALRKQLTAPAFRLKGGGWYETDFKQSNRRNLADGGGSDGAESKPTASSAKPETASAKPETASAASTESKPAPAASA